jgi:hypothetical protein
MGVETTYASNISMAGICLGAIPDHRRGGANLRQISGRFRQERNTALSFSRCLNGCGRCGLGLPRPIAEGAGGIGRAADVSFGKPPAYQLVG